MTETEKERTWLEYTTKQGGKLQEGAGRGITVQTPETYLIASGLV